MKIVAEVTCGACPLQIEGSISEHPFYFRARWESWSLGVCVPGPEADPVGNPDWRFQGVWGGPYQAGAMMKEMGQQIIEILAPTVLAIAEQVGTGPRRKEGT